MVCIVIPIRAIIAITFAAIPDYFYYNDYTDYSKNNNNK